MTSSNNTDFRKLAAEADSEREKEMKSHKEAQRLKLEIDQQNNEDDSNERSSVSALSDSTSSKYGSRTSSIEPVGPDVRIRQLEEQNKEFKLAYIKLDEHKEMVSYQLNLIRDQIEDLSESLRLSQKELAEKKKLAAYQRHQIDQLTGQSQFLGSQVELRDRLIMDRGLVIHPSPPQEEEPPVSGSQAAGDASQAITGTALLSHDIVELLRQLAETDLEGCIKRLFEERTRYMEEIKGLQKRLDEDSGSTDNVSRSSNKKKHNGEDYDVMKSSYQNIKVQNQEYKRQLQLIQQRNTSLEADVKNYDIKVIRLEGQVKRHKSIAEECEKQETELKQSKRKIQKDFREAQSKIEDLKSENMTLTKKLEKFQKQKTKRDGE